jgi:hypothetical protein
MPSCLRQMTPWCKPHRYISVRDSGGQRATTDIAMTPSSRHLARMREPRSGDHRCVIQQFHFRIDGSWEKRSMRPLFGA